MPLLGCWRKTRHIRVHLGWQRAVLCTRTNSRYSTTQSCRCQASQFGNSTLSRGVMFGEGSEAHAGVRSASSWRQRLALARSPRERALTTSTMDLIPSTPHNNNHPTPTPICAFEKRIATTRISDSIIIKSFSTNDRLCAFRKALDRVSQTIEFRCGTVGDGISSRHATSAET